nr:hypothetical protein [Fervidicella metallireducens]
MFAYCLNNQVNMEDPNGFVAKKVFVPYVGNVDISQVMQGKSLVLNISAFKYSTPWGYCWCEQIVIEKVDMLIGNKEFGFQKCYQIRAYYIGDYKWKNKVNDYIGKVGFTTSVVGYTKTGQKILGKISGKLGEKVFERMGLATFVISKLYSGYIGRYEDGKMPDYKILYSSFE